MASDVKPGKPKAVEVLGMKLVMFRDAKDGNKIKAINDICPHRAAPLSGGWLEEKNGHTCVVCPYHGWAFDGNGKLHDVPAAEEVPHIIALPQGSCDALSTYMRANFSDT